MTKVWQVTDPHGNVTYTVAEDGLAALRAWSVYTERDVVWDDICHWHDGEITAPVVGWTGQAVVSEIPIYY